MVQSLKIRDFNVCSRRIIDLFQVEVAGVKVVVVEVAVTEGYVAVPVRGHPEVGVMIGDLVEGLEMTEVLEVVVTVEIVETEEVIEVVHEQEVTVVQGGEVQIEKGVGGQAAGETRVKTVAVDSQTIMNNRMQTSSHWATQHLATGVG